MIFNNSYRGEDPSAWLLGWLKADSSEPVSKPMVLSGVKNKDIYVVLAEIFVEHGIKNRDSLKGFCVRNSTGGSKCDAIYKMVYDRLPGVLTMHRDGETGAQARIRWAYQAMLPGYSIYNAKKFPVVEEPVEVAVIDSSDDDDDDDDRVVGV